VINRPWDSITAIPTKSTVYLHESIGEIIRTLPENFLLTFGEINNINKRNIFTCLFPGIVDDPNCTGEELPLNMSTII